MTPATPTYGSFYGPHAGRPRPLCPYEIEADSCFRSKVIRGPKISKLGHMTQATPI